MIAIRCDYPTKRVIPDKGLVRKKQPYGRHLERYKRRYTLHWKPPFVRCKLLVLHATKGWRFL